MERLIDITVEGDLDVRPYLGLDGPRPRVTAVRAQAREDSHGASREELADLWEYVQRTSPVSDVLAGPVPVSGDLHCEAAR